MWVGNKVFNEFYKVPEDFVSNHIGPEGWRSVSEQQAEEFLVGLKSLFLIIESAESANG